MEFDCLFTAVQGIMRSHQNTTTVSFNRVSKDNDIVSANIVQSVDRLITEISLKDEHRRKINLFFLINTDFPGIQALEDDQNFWHLLGCLPKMSTYLYFTIATHLHFHPFIGETVLSCPEFLAIEILEAIIEYTKVLKAEVAVQFFSSVYECTFWKIISLQEEKKPPVVIKKFVTKFKELLSFNFNDLIVDLDWEMDKKLIYCGYVTEMLLLVLKSCIPKAKMGLKYELLDLYDFNVEFDYSKWGECKNDIHWTNHSLGILVSKCAEAIMSISVEMYMSWVEEDIKGSVDKTLQTAVREAAYYCREQVSSILHMDNEVNNLKSLITSLSNIALQPITEDDEIMKADAETIVMNLLNPKKTQVKWLKGLIRVPGIFQSSTYMQVIQDNAHLFDLEVGKVMLDTLLDFLSTSQCPRDFLDTAKELFFSCLKKQPLTLQMELLSYYFEKRCPNMLQKENFEEVLITTLNRLSATNENKDEVLKETVMLCFENNEVLVQSLLKECLGSSLKADLLLDLLTQIPPLANIPCTNSHLGLLLNSTVHLMDTVKTSLDKKKDNFIQLVRKLCILGILDGNIFFPDHVMPRFEESIKEEDSQSILFYLDLLNVYIAESALPKNAAALLVFFARFLNMTRPRLTNFSLEKMSATTKAIDIVQELSKKIADSKNQEDEEIRWLREMVGELKESSRLHMRYLWSKWGVASPPLPDWATEGLGLGEALPSATPEQRRHIVTSTVKVLPTITIKEWYLLGFLDSAKSALIIPTVEAIVEAILVSLQVPALVKNLQIINNILINFSQFLWEKVIPKLKTRNEAELEKLKERISHLEEVLPEELQKTKAPQIQLILQAINKLSHKASVKLSS